MKTKILMLTLISLVAIAAYASEPPHPEKLLSAGLAALEKKRPQEAYKQFIKVHQIVSPHPDKEIDAFVQRASNGESNSFALIAFYIWTGYVGFSEDKPAGKLALVRALTDGSAQASYWIAQTFFQANEEDNQKRADNFLAGLQWLGVSSGMGESSAHDKAMEIIEKNANSDQQLKTTLMAAYKSGLDESKNYKHDAATEKTNDKNSGSTRKMH